MKQQTEMEYHVTSLVVHAAPGTLEAVTTAIQALEGAEVHASSPEGKLVVTLEGESRARSWITSKQSTVCPGYCPAVLSIIRSILSLSVKQKK